MFNSYDSETRRKVNEYLKRCHLAWVLDSSGFYRLKAENERSGQQLSLTFEDIHKDE